MKHAFVDLVYSNYYYYYPSFIIVLYIVIVLVVLTIGHFSERDTIPTNIKSTNNQQITTITNGEQIQNLL